MTNKLKNIISNLIGLGVIALGTVVYLNTTNLYHFVALFVIGLACFLFKVSETKTWLSKALGKAVSKDTCEHDQLMSRVDTIGDGSNPDKEQK